MKWRRLSSAILAAVMAGTLMAGSAYAEGNALLPNEDPVNTVESDETLIVGMAAEPSMLWGAACGKLENEEQIINRAFMDTLVRVDPVTNEAEPNVASSWEWIDSTHCRFSLRDDVIMTDGTPLVADDVVFSVNTWMEQSPNNDTGKFLSGAVAEDEHTVVIEYNTVAPDMILLMGWTNFGIASEAEVEALGGLEEATKNPVIGSGRYRFKEWAHGQYITLERNEDYWNPDYKGYFKEIKFTFTQDAAAREMAVEAGDSDVAYDMPVVQAAHFAESDKVKTYVYSMGQVLHLWYNMGEQAGPTKDPKVREAIDKALNFEAIALVGTAGFADQALGYVAPTSKFYSETSTVEERAVDIEGAKALLEEAGYGDGFEISMLGLQDLSQVMTVIQGSLAEIGIKLNLDTPDTAQFVEKSFAGEYDLIAVGDNLVTRIPPLIPFILTSNVYGPGVVIGGPKYATPEYDEKVAAIIAETDEAKTKELVLDLENQMKDERLCSNLYTEMKASVTAADIKGYTTIERGYIDVTTLYK